MIHDTPNLQSTEVVVEARTASPEVGSGILHTGAIILGRRGDGLIVAYVQTYLRHGQEFPSVGARCIFEHGPYRDLPLVSGLETRKYQLPVVLETEPLGDEPEFDGADENVPLGHDETPTWELIHRFDCDRTSPLLGD